MQRPVRNWRAWFHSNAVHFAAAAGTDNGPPGAGAAEAPQDTARRPSGVSYRALLRRLATTPLLRSASSSHVGTRAAPSEAEGSDNDVLARRARRSSRGGARRNRMAVPPGLPTGVRAITSASAQRSVVLVDRGTGMASPPVTPREDSAAARAQKAYMSPSSRGKGAASGGRRLYDDGGSSGMDDPAGAARSCTKADDGAATGAAGRSACPDEACGPSILVTSCEYVTQEAYEFGIAKARHMSTYGDWSSLGHAHAYAVGFLDAVQECTPDAWKWVAPEYVVTRSHGFAMASALTTRTRNMPGSQGAQMLLRVLTMEQRGVIDRCAGMTI